jgi:vacuolar-type H+-ATPase subunit H
LGASSGERAMTRADTLIKVKEAEAKATQLVKDSQEKQRMIVSDARREAISKIQNADAKMKEDKEKVISSEKMKLDVIKKEKLAKGNDEAKKAHSIPESKVLEIKTHLKDSFENSL